MVALPGCRLHAARCSLPLLHPSLRRSRVCTHGVAVHALAAAAVLPSSSRRLFLVQARAALERAHLRLQRARQALQHAVLRAQPLRLLAPVLRLVLRAGAQCLNFSGARIRDVNLLMSLLRLLRVGIAAL